MSIKRDPGPTKKRLATMRRVQLTALELFEARGYSAVTIEEIAAAAEVSAPTVYRHFGSKEQLVLWDEYDPLIFAALAERTAGSTLLGRATAALIKAIDSVYQADSKRILRRAKLMRAEPALRRANAASMGAMCEGFAAALLSSGAARDDLEAEVVAGALVAALQTSVRHWEKSRGARPLRAFVREGLARLAALTRRGGVRRARSGR